MPPTFHFACYAFIFFFSAAILILPPRHRH
jgi:hypothetical protein